MAWEEPDPLEEYERPPFPMHCLPTVLHEFALAIAEQLQVPPDMPALLSLAAVSTACAGKVRIQAPLGWTEPIQTYALACMGVGERKSPAVNYACAPLLAWQMQQYDALKVASEQSQSKRRMLQSQLTKAEGKGDEERAADLAKQLAEFVDIVPPRLLADDITPEALARIMVQNHGCASIWSAEGGFISMLGGRYSKDGSANIDLVLKAHPGDPVFIDRVGRPSEAIRQPALTLMLAVQPSVLAELMENKIFRDRGLCGRFLYSLPGSLIGRRKTPIKPISEALETEYGRVITCLLDIPYPAERHTLRLSETAGEVFDAWGEEIEPHLADDWQHIAGWANKLQGLTLRLAGQLHMVSCRSWETPIPEPTIQNAITIARYAVAHALAAFGTCSTDSATANASKVLEGLKKAGLIAFSKRDVMRANRNFKNAKDLDPALALLEEKGFIRSDILTSPYDSIGQPQGVRWFVNPRIVPNT